MSMFNIIPLIIILISLSIIIVLVVRKFSALANLDVDNMPAEKEARFKEKLISERLKRSILKWNFKIKKNVGPVMDSTGRGLTWAYEKLNELKDKHRPVKKISEDDFEKKISDLYIKVEDLLKEDKLVEAEKLLIEIIGMSSKDKKAFKMLADLYFEKKSFEESCQTYEYVLKIIDDANNGSEDISPEILAEKARLYFDISLVCKEQEDFTKADKYIKLALEIESNNPRFLDTLVEISIINKDKEGAQEALERLRKSNPENQKLPEIEDKINLL